MKKWIVIVVSLLVVAGVVVTFWRPVEPPPVVVATPVTLPASQPSTAPAPVPVVRTFVDVVRAAHPDFPTTQPLGVPLDYSEAARIVLNSPVYLSPPPRSDLWVTNPDAPELVDVFRAKDFARQHTFVVRERVTCVHWLNPEPPDESPKRVLVTKANDGGVSFLDRDGKVLTLPFNTKSVDWSRADWWNDMLVLPGASVVAVVTFAPAPIVYQTEFAGVTPTYVCSDAAGGLLAWSGASNGSVRRFSSGQWTTLDPAAGWSSRVLQLVPLLDGSVLQIALGPAGNEDLVDLKLIPLAPGGSNVDEKRLAQLVDQLTDLSQRKRDAATDELSRYGPEAWPVLEKLIVDQPPEVLLRMKRVMGNRLQPTLAGMKLVDGRMKLVTRLSDGGCVFYSNSGVSIARRDGGEDVVAPAWISVRPGRPIARLSDALVRDLNPDHATLDAFGDEWVVTDKSQGPRRLLGNRLVKLLRDDERSAGFDTVVGVDRRGRWLFRKSSDAPSTGATLIVDPTLPDPTPKLPAWTFAEAKEVGWTHDGWPAVRKGSTWSLREDGWQLEPPKPGQEMQTRLDPPSQVDASPVAPVSALPSSTTTTQSLSVEERYGPPVLTLSDGTRVFDGYTKLVVDDQGSETVWPLPADVVGAPPFPVTLLASKDGVWFLFNQPGRVIRLKRTPAGFKVEATFTKDVPDIDQPTRTWLDPAGRIVLLWDNKVTVFFPEGRIPAGIRNLMTGGTEE